MRVDWKLVEKQNRTALFRMLIVLLVVTLFSGCATPEKSTEVGHMEMEVTGQDGGGKHPVSYVQMFAIFAPGATSDITSTNKQTAEQDLDGNLGYNGQASSGSGNQDGVWRMLRPVLERAGLIPPEDPEDDIEETEEPEETVGTGEAEPVASKYFHHWNPRSWDGRGSSIVLCPNDHMDKCWLNGEKLEEHGNTDTDNRQIWTNRDTPGLGGIVVCARGNKRYAFKVDGSGGIYYGKC